MKTNQNNKSNTLQFIEKAIKIHGSKFDYAKVEYNGSHKKVCIICPEHGDFYQTPTNHLSGNGCMQCAAQYKRGKYRLTTLESFIDQAKKIHGEKYDYSKVDWKNTYTRVTILCPVHGEFNQIPQNHIRLKCGCRKCGREIAKAKVNKYDTNYFIEQSKKMHGDRYDYSKSECFNATDKVIIICRAHGEYKQNANQHLEGHGCPKCNFDQMAIDRSMGKEAFLAKAKELFGEKYDYSKVNYVNGQRHVLVICPSHGKFRVTPNSHLSRKSGCPICNESKLERKTAAILDNYNVRYERLRKFSWLGRQSLDFYLPEYHVAIECLGIQHFKPVDFAGKGQEWAYKFLKENKKRDERKLQKCVGNGIDVIYVVDNEEYLEHKYHFDVCEPFSPPVSYRILHVMHFEAQLERIIETRFL